MKLLSHARFNRIRKIIKILTAMLFLTFLFVEGLILSGFHEQAPEVWIISLFWERKY